MKIIFLDIDGVLNSETSCIESMKYEKHECDELGRDMPHIMHIKWLNKIIEETGAKVVLSSAWRSSFSYLGIWRLLWSVGFKGTVIGKTPYLDSYRGTEIKCWLEEHKSKIIKHKDSSWVLYKEPVESFVILDDDSDMEDLSDNLVQTESRKGLLRKHYKLAVKILNKE